MGNITDTDRLAMIAYALARVRPKIYYFQIRELCKTSGEM